MASPDLPPDLATLEQQLTARGRSDPTAELRQRVLATVRRELRPHERLPLWQFAGATAAAALLWINLSTSVANNTNWQLAGELDAERLAATARRIQTLAPELPEREVYRQALLSQTVPSVAAPCPSPNQFLRRKGPHEWVTH